jgi:hypothetical protein
MCHLLCAQYKKVRKKTYVEASPNSGTKSNEEESYARKLAITSSFYLIGDVIKIGLCLLRVFHPSKELPHDI